MPQLSCCTYRQDSSPELPGIRHVDLSGDTSCGLLERSIAPIFARTPDCSKNDEEAREIRKIFASSSHDASELRNLHPLANRGLLEVDREHVDHRANTSRLSQVIRQRFSRESGLSTNSIKARSKVSMSQEEIERRRGTKQRFLQEEEEKILDDCRASQGGYDNDAEQIATLRITKNRSGGVIKISPQLLTDAVERNQNLLALGHQHSLSRCHRSTIPILSENLSHTTDKFKGPVSAEKEECQSVVTDIQEEKGGDTNESSKHGEREITAAIPRRANTLLEPLPQNPHSSKDSTQSVNLSFHSLEADQSIHIIEVPLSPDLLPLRMPSIVSQKGRRLSSRSTGTTCLPTMAGAADAILDIVVNPIISNPTKWPHGIIELQKSPESGGKTRKSASEGDVLEREVVFGGIDGASPHNSLLHPRSARRELSSPRSRRTEPLYVGSIPGGPILQPSPSNSLLVGTSLSNLETLVRHELHSPTSNGSMKVISRKESGRQQSTSGYADARFEYFGSFVPKDNASSVYASQPSSPFSSPSNSTMHIPNLFHKLEDYQSTNLHGLSVDHAFKSLLDLTHGTGGHRKTFNLDVGSCHTQDNSSIHSSTASMRAQELEEANVRIAQRAKAFTFQKNGRFREGIEDTARGVVSHKSHPMQGTRHSRTSSLNTSNEWLSSSKRNGYGYSFIPTENDNVTKVWGRALQDYVVDLQSVSSKSTGRALHLHGRQTSINKTRHRQTRKRSAIFRKRDTLASLRGNAKNQNNDEISTETITSSAIQSEREWKSQSLSRRPLKSWSRFPSYSRPSRSNTPAGEAESVSTQDFVPQAVATTRANDINNEGLSLGKKKSRSMTFGRSIFKSWTRLYKSRSFDFRRFERGHRSSISVGGDLEYPELEILPPLSQQLLYIQEQGLSTYSLGSDGVLQSIISHEGTMQPVNNVPMGRNAKVWSKLYQDCVEYPRDTEEISTLETPVSKLRPEPSSDLPEHQHPCKQSLKSGTDT